MRRTCCSRCWSGSRTSTCTRTRSTTRRWASIFEELIRKFNEALNENPGEHFTPREVIRLMVDLMLAGDEDASGARAWSAPSTTLAAAPAAC